jgi:hypothetical protein
MINTWASAVIGPTGMRHQPQCFGSLDPLGLDLRGIANPELESKFVQQSLEPAFIPGSLHSYTHADSSSL